MKKILALPAELYQNRKLVLSLAKMISKQNMQDPILVLSGHLSSLS